MAFTVHGKVVVRKSKRQGAGGKSSRLRGGGSGSSSTVEHGNTNHVNSSSSRGGGRHSIGRGSGVVPNDGVGPPAKKKGLHRRRAGLQGEPWVAMWAQGFDTEEEVCTCVHVWRCMLQCCSLENLKVCANASEEFNARGIFYGGREVVNVVFLAVPCPSLPSSLSFPFLLFIYFFILSLVFVQCTPCVLYFYYHPRPHISLSRDPGIRG